MLIYYRVGNHLGFPIDRVKICLAVSPNCIVTGTTNLRYEHEISQVTGQKTPMRQTRKSL